MYVGCGHEMCLCACGRPDLCGAKSRRLASAADVRASPLDHDRKAPKKQTARRTITSHV